jgi:hypothetical protein
MSVETFARRLVISSTHVRSSHRGSRNGVAGHVSVGPDRQDVQTRRKDVDTLAEVAIERHLVRPPESHAVSEIRSDPPEVSPLVTQSRGTDGDRLLGPSRGIVTGVLVVVTGSDGDEGDLSGRIDSVVCGSGLASSEGHRDDWKGSNRGSA